MGIYGGVSALRFAKLHHFTPSRGFSLPKMSPEGMAAQVLTNVPAHQGRPLRKAAQQAMLEAKAAARKHRPAPAHRRLSMTLSTSAAAPVYSALGNDPDLADLVDLFVEEIPRRVRSMEDALGDFDWELLRTLTHQMSGAAGSYGFHGLTAHARELENAAGTRDELAAVAALEAFAAVCCRLRAGAPRPDRS
jgi:HPt (histidine-containing phosphotransfer) domain-containing protein